MLSRQARLTLLLAGLSLAPAAAHAQPSGGPYGPIPQTYDVPKTAGHVYYVAPDGKADTAGAAPSEPTTIESAIARVVTRRRHHHARRHVSDRWDGVQSGHHDSALSRRGAGSEGHGGRDPVGGLARRRLAHTVEAAVSAEAGRLVAAGP